MNISHFAGASNLRHILWCGVIAVMLAILFPCLLLAQTASHGSGSVPSTAQSLTTQPATAVDAGAHAAVMELLQRAMAARVQLSDDEIRELASLQKEYTEEDIKNLLQDCNNSEYEERYSDKLWQTAETTCEYLGNLIAPNPLSSKAQGLGPTNPAAEVAFARSCALPIVGEVQIVADGCANLSRLFARRNNMDMALAVVEYAPKCQGKPHAQATIHPIDQDQLPDNANSQLEGCLYQEAELLREMHRPQEERVVDAALCNAADETGCGLLAELGVQVDMKAVEQRQSALQAAAESTAEADSAVRTQAQADRSAQFNAVLDTLHSMPGGSDPNAIVGTANQQAANMIALGAANDAARAQAAAERAAAQQREQIAEQQREAQTQISSTPVAEVSPADQTGTPSGSVSSGSPASQTGATPSGATAPQTGGSNDSGSGQFTSSMASSCIRMFNDSSMYGWVALQNTCSQKMTVTFEGRNGNGGVFGTLDLAPGQSYNTGFSPSEIAAAGGIYTYPCPYGYIPTNMNGQAVTGPVAQFTCKYRGY